MRPDVLALKQFYATPLGQLAASRLSARLGWRDGQDIRDRRLLGLGYAVPYLPPALAAGAERVVAFMPDRQGAVAWPEPGPGLTVMGDDTALPFPDALFDHVLLAHALEFVDHARGLLAEVWRVLAPGGTVTLLVPNRRSIWARLDVTPFGNGRPFSRAQLAALLNDSLLSPTDWRQALFMPPLLSPALIRALAGLDRAGRLLWPGWGGVHIVRATKVIYAARPRRKPLRRPMLAPALGAPMPSARVMVGARSKPR
ncbi:MAG: class I SAM-dependent methyltransferase [Sphingomonadales bacterium]